MSYFGTYLEVEWTDLVIKDMKLKVIEPQTGIPFGHILIGKVTRKQLIEISEKWLHKLG